jgi:AcrR family transcriptional regulator
MTSSKNEDAGGAPPKSKGARTADRLLDAAEILFAQHGYEATALRDIADAVNISQPGLYKHFESKDALYRQVLQRALQPLADEMEATVRRPVREASFRTLTSRLIDVLAQHPNVSMLLVRSMLSPPSERDEIGMEWVGRLADYGQRITRAADLEPDADDLALQIVAIFNLMFGYFWAAPLVRSLSRVDPLHPAMISRQKALLARFVTALEFGEDGQTATLTDDLPG